MRSELSALEGATRGAANEVVTAGDDRSLAVGLQDRLRITGPSEIAGDDRVPYRCVVRLQSAHRVVVTLVAQAATVQRDRRANDRAVLGDDSADGHTAGVIAADRAVDDLAVDCVDTTCARPT